MPDSSSQRGADGQATPSGGGDALTKKTINSMPHRKPLYIQMALKDNEAEKVSLEEHKKRMAEIRSLHKPLEKKDMMDHALNYERIRQEKELKKKQRRKADLQAEKERRNILPTFKQIRTSTDDVLDVLREPGQLLGIEREKAEIAKAKRQAHEKIHNYGKYVREMYWPKVSEKNQSEMTSIKHKVMSENTAKRQAP